MNKTQVYRERTTLTPSEDTSSTSTTNQSSDDKASCGAPATFSIAGNQSSDDKASSGALATISTAGNQSSDDTASCGAPATISIASLSCQHSREKGRRIKKRKERERGPGTLHSMLQSDWPG